MGGLGQLFPKTVAQLTGILVAAIVAFGTDTDLFIAIPLGVFAGALATLFVTLSEAGRRRPAPRERWRDPRYQAARWDRPDVNRRRGGWN